MQWVPWVISGMAFLVGLVGLLRTFVVAGQDQSAKFTASLAGLLERVGLLEMKTGVFWRLVEEHLSTLLKKPIHLELDDLLDKLKAHTLTLDEAYILQRLLDETYLQNEVDHANQRVVAILVMGAVESLIHELERKQ